MYQPIIIITRRETRIYRTEREACAACGISRHSLRKALRSDDGLIFGTQPPTCADYALLPEAEIEAYYAKRSEKQTGQIDKGDSDGL